MLCYTTGTMTTKFIDVFSRTDWVKISILVVVAIGLWIWVYVEMQKPIIPPEWDQEFGITTTTDSQLNDFQLD